MKSFLVGLQFLTRLRLDTQTEWKDEDFGKSVAWFPVIGWIIGLLLCGVFFLIRPLGSPLLIGFILVISELYITGALLLDGLMDSADGLFSGRSKEKPGNYERQPCRSFWGTFCLIDSSLKNIRAGFC